MNAPPFDSNVNLLVLGKTGVGKSSLLNYLFGEAVAPTGAGRPVTGQGLFRCRPFAYRNLNITVYDSWGLEPDKAEQWERLIQQELDSRDDQAIADWFHAIVYCIDAKRSRLEDFERTCVIDRIIDAGNKVNFALTRAGLASRANLDGIRQILASHYPRQECCEVESLHARLLGGKTTTPFGREVLLDQICKNLRKNMLFKAIRHFEKEFLASLRECRQASLQCYEEETSVRTIFSESVLDRLMWHISAIYSAKLSRASETFARHIEECALFYDRIANAFTGEKINFWKKTLQFTSIDGWNNDANDYFSSIMATIMFPPGFFVRKDIYRDKIEKYLDDCTAEIRRQLYRQISELCYAEELDLHCAT